MLNLPELSVPLEVVPALVALFQVLPGLFHPHLSLPKNRFLQSLDLWSTFARTRLFNNLASVDPSARVLSALDAINALLIGHA